MIRVVNFTLSTLLGFANAAFADIILQEPHNSRSDFTFAKPASAVSVTSNNSGFYQLDALYGFAQDKTDWQNPTSAALQLWFCDSNSKLGINCVAAPSSFLKSSTSAFTFEEKSVRYVQTKLFQSYVMPSSRDIASVTDRISISQKELGTQSNMLVMTR
jgi:hypothetical protein